MNKEKKSTESRSASRSQRPVGHSTKVNNASVGAVEPDSTVTVKVASGTIDFRKMAEDAARIQEYIANGCKPEELSGIRFFRPTGLFDNRE